MSCAAPRRFLFFLLVATADPIGKSDGNIPPRGNKLQAATLSEFHGATEIRELVDSMLGECFTTDCYRNGDPEIL